MMKPWIGVDLDGTLAFYDHWRGEEHIGEPLPLMVNRIRQWLIEGKEVRIFTARVGTGWTRNSDNQEHNDLLVRHVIETWCHKHIGQTLPITSVKDYGMIELWDDRAVQVVPNTGKTLAEEHEAVLSALQGKAATPPPNGVKQIITGQWVFWDEPWTYGPYDTEEEARAARTRFCQEPLGEKV